MTTPQGPGQTPAGWYPDPSGSGQQRYYDGSQWTEHYAPGEGGAAQGSMPVAPGANAPVRGSAPVGPPPNLWWGVPAALALLVIGSIGPWVSVDIEIFGQSRSDSESGLESDGILTLILAIIAGVLLVLWRAQRKAWQAIVAAVLGALALLICVVDVIDVGDAQERSIGDVGVGWGLWIALIGSIALLVVSILLTIQSGRRTS